MSPTKNALPFPRFPNPQYVPVIQKGNERHVHHMLLYECHVSDSERHFEKWLDVEGAQCYGPNMPVSWYKCNAPLIAWAVGSEGK